MSYKMPTPTTEGVTMDNMKMNSWYCTIGFVKSSVAFKLDIIFVDMASPFFWKYMNSPEPKKHNTATNNAMSGTRLLSTIKTN